MALEHFPPEERQALYARVIGEQKTDRYLRIFERFYNQRGPAGFLS